MTFFLNAPAQPPKIESNNPDIELADGWFDALGAGITAAQLENDANFVGRRRTVEARASAAWDAADRLGSDTIADRAREKGMTDDQINAFLAVKDRRPNSMPESIRSVISELAGEAAADDPQAWADIDLSDEGAYERANETMRAEYEDAQAILDMMPGGQAVARFAGGMIGMTADVKNLPFLLMGGGSGSLMRVMGREAAINMAAEAAFMPSQFEMAERLEIPDPNVATQLAIAGAAGGILGGAMEAGARGVTYWRGRNTVQPMRGYDEIQTTQMVDEAEDILTSDTPQPFEQIQQMMEENPPGPPYLLENPINPERPPLVNPPREEPPENPSINEDTVAAFDEAIAEARAADRTTARPLAQSLSNSWRGGGESLQIHPDGMLGQELKARGVTSKTMPGLFSKKGRKDLDNLVASEWEEAFPGITQAAGVAEDGIYLDRDGFIDVLVRDIDGDQSWLTTRAEVERLEAEKEEYLRWGDNDAVTDYRSMEPPDDPDGLFIDPARGFTRREIEVMFDEWAEQKEFADILTEAERAEIVDELRASGGDPQYLVEQALSRELDYAESPDVRPEEAAEDIPFGEPGDARGQPVGERGAFTGEAGSRGARAEGSGPSVAATEITDAGEQIVAPGIAPVSQRQRLEAAQAAPMRGGNAAADDGLFDVGSRAQRDMFSDPAGPDAETIHQTVMDDFRTDIERDGPTEMLMDDGRVMTDQEAIAELDADQEFLEVMNLCGRTGE